MKNIRGRRPQTARTPKIVAQMPEDKSLPSPEQAAKQDGHPGSCQI